jgi:hypothetical protein
MVSTAVAGTPKALAQNIYINACFSLVYIQGEN